MPAPATTLTATCLALTRAISRSRTVEEIYAAALDALATGLGVERSAILIFDADGVMRFKSARGLSEAYRRTVEGHSPWQPDTSNPEPIVVSDVRREPSLAAYRDAIESEGIASMAFIPLVSLDRVIGKFMLYYEVPTTPSEEDLQLADLIALQVAFAVERTRAEAQARWSEERLLFALDAASMGTWDWDLTTNAVEWSDNLARIHGLPDGAFDGTFASYEREIHPDDRDRVQASIARALNDGAPHDVEYRLVAPDGTVRWCEGKGRVERQDGRPVRMSGVCMMVTRRKEAELAKLAAAEESSRLKDEFLATLSHELRTPLNAILGWTQMLQSGELAAERARQAIDVIARNARLQAQLIEDILDVSRIIAGKLEMERVPLSIAQVVDTVVAGSSPAAEAKGITIERRVEPELPPVEGDPKRLYQVLNNVVTNAVKFTPEGGSISLGCTTEGPWLRIDIRDSGIGIPREFLPYVFDRFRQADSKATRTHGGLGLGLAITQYLVQRHGGTIAAHSDGPGQGTTMTIHLPADTAAEPDTPAWPSPPDVRLDDLTILVVDDQRDAREMLAILLEQRGARVRQCECAESALKLLQSNPVQLLIADIAMPNVDGYELIQRVRSSGNQMPAIAVTGFARIDDKQKALASGYTAYCAKPINGPQLARMARNLVA